MKKIKAALLLLLLVAICISVVSCGTNESVKGVITVVVENENVGTSSVVDTTAYEVDLDKVTGEGVKGVFEYLKENENLTFEMSSGMINKLGSLYNDYTAGTYIYLYTSIEADFDVSQYKMTKEYGDITLTSSGVGIDDMHLEEGCIIYVGTISYG